MLIKSNNRKHSIHSFKKVRENINLNKPSKKVNQESCNWATNWLEQTSEMKSECAVVNQATLQNVNFIIKWWENN